jgi:hypothetical protein
VLTSEDDGAAVVTPGRAPPPLKEAEGGEGGDSESNTPPAEAPEAEKVPDVVRVPSTACVTFIWRVVGLLHQAAAKPTHKIQQLLGVLRYFAEIGPSERKGMFRRVFLFFFVGLLV